MGRKIAIRGLALAAIVAVVITPIATYGQGWGGTRNQSNTEALVALSTAFTFQGSLADGGSPATGSYDFNFVLYDALAGGVQVGPAQPVADTAVSAGLFTVLLDFGDVFHGSQYFLEIQVRAGDSAGAYTTLTPRQAISAVPNASYALRAGSAGGLQGIEVASALPLAGDVLRYNGSEWAPSALGGGGFSVPFSASAANAGALITLTNTGNTASATALIGKTESTAGGAYGLVGEVTSTSPGASSAGVRGINNGTAGSGIGVYGSQDGSGWGVYGQTPDGRGVYGNSGTGTGVYGISSTGTGGRFSSVSGVALEVDGKIQVGGSAPAAFEWTVTGASIDCAGDFCTNIDNPATNGFPDAILIVTHRYAGYNPHPVGVNYVGGKWRIYNEDTAAMPVGTKFNVLVIHP
jgi:hypothetical protein